MNPDPKRKPARELAASHIASGNPLGWFDVLYRQADGVAQNIPWADQQPNSHFVEWFNRSTLTSGRALVVGCGLGDDAEFLASHGWAVEAFDISEEAIRWAKKRFPNSNVRYQAVDLFNAPQNWLRNFDLVVEIYTLQVLPSDLRERALPIVADWVAPRGLLCAIARGRESSDHPGQMPWPLTKAEFLAMEKTGLKCQSFEDFFDREDPPVRRFRAIFVRPAK